MKNHSLFIARRGEEGRMIFFLWGGGGSNGYRGGGGISHSQQCIKGKRDYEKLTANELLLRGDHKNIKPKFSNLPPPLPRALLHAINDGWSPKARVKFEPKHSNAQMLE